ncbi:tRNA(5-methylaminomethyl-2-thiouridylate) methyltransferase [Methanococcoides methylutens]|uniref:tRNA(5-methylaminomethyl-2-thiouridylate) methyltransferase n=1 Tax=Methanococcoides methylutens TaxID=2226 RepID=A0A099T0R7_METMT|nr:tRNA (5-methylaminomethyl-2-thiouridylate)-methyltransferase [Methanococcoides methylutens]KGK98742.1 tRNA(5-methylaminomethyl-2-thiouridylate) methyltransferase [Methanococcoides methylutens]
MKAQVLFSGGKDSSLSAILLDPFFDVELVTCSFSILPVGEVAKVAADELGYSHRVLELDRCILESALEIIIDDGYPRNAINYIHKAVIETLAKEDEVSLIADGVRRDDRVPKLTDSEVRSIEDRFSVSYICPLHGYGRSAVNLLVSRYLVIEEGQSDSIAKADYETELRELIRQQYGDEKVLEIFPEHVQSRVIRRV